MPAFPRSGKPVRVSNLRISLLVAALASWVGLSGCGTSFDKAYEEATKGKTGQALYEELLRLDQAHPNQLRLKTELGSRLLSAGDLIGVKAYLDRGEELIGPFRPHDPRSEYALYADKAELHLRGGDFPRACAYATKALARKSEDSLGVVFTKAKAEDALDDKAAALRDFDRGWSSRKKSMGAEDYRSYAIALKRAGREADAIQVSTEYQEAWPYDPGIGFLESGCHEGLGDMGAAVVSAFKDYEFSRPFGGISDEALIESLDAAAKKGDALQSASRQELERLVSSLKAFVRGEWKSVAEAPGKGFGEYIGLAARLESGSASVPELERYLLLEPSLKSFQAYYFHLWKGMKKAPPSYSAKAARPILEKCVTLAPASAMARESRRELGRLVGIGDAAGEKLLVPTEIDGIFSDILAGSPFSRLEPVMALLGTPDNDYQLSCMYALGRFSADPAMKAYIAAKAGTASGKLRERLTCILSRG